MSHFLLFCDVRHQVVYVVYTAVKQEGRRRENENVYINTYIMVHVLFNQSAPPPHQRKMRNAKKAATTRRLQASRESRGQLRNIVITFYIVDFIFVLHTLTINLTVNPTWNLFLNVSLTLFHAHASLPWQRSPDS